MYINNVYKTYIHIVYKNILSKKNAGATNKVV